VGNDVAEAVANVKLWLRPFEEHLQTAGLGHISEVADGNAPHGPAGCIAQAWSVAELLRAIAEDVLAIVNRCARLANHRINPDPVVERKSDIDRCHATN